MVNRNVIEYRLFSIFSLKKNTLSISEYIQILKNNFYSPLIRILRIIKMIMYKSYMIQIVFSHIVYSHRITKEVRRILTNFDQNRENGSSLEDSATKSSPLRRIIFDPQTFRQTIPRRKSCLQLLGEQFRGRRRIMT